MASDPRLAASLQGGVRDDNSGVDFTGDCSAAMSAAMNAEDRRRQLAAGRPGYGAAMHLPQSPAGPSVGKASLDMPPWLGYDRAPEVSPAVSVAYTVP